MNKYDKNITNPLKLSPIIKPDLNGSDGELNNSSDRRDVEDSGAESSTDSEEENVDKNSCGVQLNEIETVFLTENSYDKRDESDKETTEEINVEPDYIVIDDENPTQALKKRNDVIVKKNGEVIQLRKSPRNIKRVTIDASVFKAEKIYTCEICSKDFKLADRLRKHRSVHTDERNFKCDSCPKAFKDKAGLRKHTRNVHASEKNYKCKICNKSYASGTQLKNHELVHGDQPKFECKVCNKKFVKQDYLKIHAFFHSGEKPFKCDICNKSFTMSGTLVEHRRIHTGEKPHKCEVCNKTFVGRSNLRRHRYIHLEERPYKCELCLKSFVCPAFLRNHKAKHSDYVQS